MNIKELSPEVAERLDEITYAINGEDAAKTATYLLEVFQLGQKSVRDAAPALPEERSCPLYGITELRAGFRACEREKCQMWWPAAGDCGWKR